MTLGDMCIWVVSDDERLQGAISFVLSESGLSFSRFSSSKHALDMLCVSCPAFMAIAASCQAPP
jgi:hypothetical protein